jgi:hypothetical protein
MPLLLARKRLRELSEKRTACFPVAWAGSPIAVGTPICTDLSHASRQGEDRYGFLIL